MAEVIVNKITGEVIEGYDQKDLSLIPAFEVTSQFTPSTDNVEFSIYNEQGILEYINYNYTNYQVTLNYNSQNNSVSTVTVDPEKDLIREGYEQGKYTTYYNFVRNQISSSQELPFFITQISSDRTEIRVVNNSLSNEELEKGVNNFISELGDSPYFEDFRVNFGNNNIFIANNALLDTSNETQYTLLIKLYEPLPSQIELKDSLVVTLQTADEISYKVSFRDKVIPPPKPLTIGGPNFALNLADKANNATKYKTSGELLTTNLTSSYNQILNILNEKGIEVNIDYSDFNNFIYFGSAEERVNNFYYKVGLIEAYDNEITTLDGLGDSDVSSSLAVLQNKKQQVIVNFDDYERYQYFSSGSSDIYPKTNTTPTYILAGTGSALALAWLEDQATNSGSLYDIESVDRLANSLPDYVKDDTRNTTFLLFMDMIGQHFDTIWTYTNDVSNRFDGDNRIDHGISKDLVKDALVSMGVNIYGNNQSDYDLFTALTDLNPTGGTSIPSGSEINTTTVDIADPQSQENLVKGVYKRIFHNLPYLIKKKGSKEGLRALINSFGVPAGLLRISEFGGYSGSLDLWKTTKAVDNQVFTGGTFNTSLTLSSGGTPKGILFRIRWNPTGSINRDSFQIPNSADIASFGSGMTLAYTGNGNLSGSYSGSIPSSSLDFYKGNLLMNGAVVTAPFFNGEWWTIYIHNRTQLKVASKLYNGDDGFTDPILITGGTGGGISGNTTTLKGNAFGSNQLEFQELRFYNATLDDQEVKDYAMNPSWMYDGRAGALSKLLFRAPLGADGRNDYVVSTNYSSVHPSVGGSNPVSSFSGNSNYTFSTPGTLAFTNNSEFVYLKEPVVGIKNRISQKITNNSPNLAGTTLSRLSSIEQNGLNKTAPSATPAVDYTEVAFSPQNEINDDIANTYGNTGFDLGNFIGNPNQFEPRNPDKANNQYLALNKESEEYFAKYNKAYDWHDYIRLIKYFDSSLFKMIKDFSPAKSNVTTGVVIKQHLLERNKSKVVSGSIENLTYSGSIGPELTWDRFTNGTGSIFKLKKGTIGNIEGGGGGVFNAVNGLEYFYSGSVFNSRGELLTDGGKPFPPGPYIPTSFVTQVFQDIIQTPSGSLKITRDTQQELYNGELKGTEVKVTDGNLNVSVPKETDESFIAPYNTVAAFDNFDQWFTEIQGSGVINGISLYYFSTFPEMEFAITFESDDQNGVNRNKYLSELTEGDTLYIKITNGDFNQGQVKELVISSISTQSVGPHTRYLFYISPILTDFPGLDFLLKASTNGFNFDIDYSLVYDDSLKEILGTRDDNDPLYNNASEIRQSSVFMDVDYSTQSGSLSPINMTQIKAQTATRAPVQDSNYTSTGYSNARYHGTRVSSLGFNIPFKQQ